MKETKRSGNRYSGFGIANGKRLDGNKDNGKPFIKFKVGYQYFKSGMKIVLSYDVYSSQDIFMNTRWTACIKSSASECFQNVERTIENSKDNSDLIGSRINHMVVGEVGDYTLLRSVDIANCLLASEYSTVSKFRMFSEVLSQYLDGMSTFILTMSLIPDSRGIISLKTALVGNFENHDAVV